MKIEKTKNFTGIKTANIANREVIMKKGKEQS